MIENIDPYQLMMMRFWIFIFCISACIGIPVALIIIWYIHKEEDIKWVFFVYSIMIWLCIITIIILISAEYPNDTIQLFLELFK